MNSLLDWLKNQLKPKKPLERQPKNRSLKPLLILCAVGILLLLISQWTSRPQAENTTAKPVSTNTGKQVANKPAADTEEARYSKELEKILSKVMGVRNVSVLVTFDTTEQTIYQENVKTTQNQTQEIDQNGGKRQVNNTQKDEQVVTIDNGTKKLPVISGKKKPEIRGVLIVAEGAETPTIKAWIMDAVSTVLDIPTYKVKVLPK
jgi:stage III sporulation protein AG